MQTSNQNMDVNVLSTGLSSQKFPGIIKPIHSLNTYTHTHTHTHTITQSHTHTNTASKYKQPNQWGNTHQSQNTILTLQVNSNARPDKVTGQHGHANTKVYYTMLRLINANHCIHFVAPQTGERNESAFGRSVQYVL